jgi:hypothetical protein
MIVGLHASSMNRSLKFQFRHYSGIAPLYSMATRYKILRVAKQGWHTWIEAEKYHFAAAKIGVIHRAQMKIHFLF